MSGSVANRERMIVALDMPSAEHARKLVDTLGTRVSFYKIGLELVMSGGLDLATDLIASGKRVFLDMKFLDISNTVERAVARVAETGISFLTIHAMDRKTLRAAVAGADGSRLKLLGVTVLTSLDESDLEEQGVTGLSPSELVLRRVELVQEAGLDGVVASGLEAAAVRAMAGPGLLVVTPGIRLTGDFKDDQVRITTADAAIGAGADYLVIGRPITEADDPAAAADMFAGLISQALR
ncbi:MAG: orotidine-5'-phosphate decarboxylase [Hyphomicrobiaceae bacterium]